MNRLPRCVSHAPALICIALVLLATVATPTSAQDTEDQDLELFFPLATRRPIIERELEFRVNHFKAGQHRETDVVGAVAAPILPRWQVELELPLVLVQRRDGAATGGIGDLTLENKFLLFQVTRAARAGRGWIRDPSPDRVGEAEPRRRGRPRAFRRGGDRAAPLRGGR